MKTMTCKDLGGPCDQTISAENKADMMKKMTQHVTANHPETALEMEKMHAENPEGWGEKFRAKWDSTADD